jgi:hypothetical protein
MASLPPDPALSPLEPLVGEWQVDVPRFPEGRGRATFEWLAVFHYDSRGVSRVYQMTFDQRLWRMWRDAPGFHQRFSGTLADDGGSIRAAWEKSPDGSTWSTPGSADRRRAAITVRRTASTRTACALVLE